MGSPESDCAPLGRSPTCRGSPSESRRPRLRRRPPPRAPLPAACTSGPPSSRRGSASAAERCPPGSERASSPSRGSAPSSPGSRRPRSARTSPSAACCRRSTCLRTRWRNQWLRHRRAGRSPVSSGLPWRFVLIDEVVDDPVDVEVEEDRTLSPVDEVAGLLGVLAEDTEVDVAVAVATDPADDRTLLGSIDAESVVDLVEEHVATSLQHLVV